jgi:ATP-dependent RNA helicase RhlE
MKGLVADGYNAASIHGNKSQGQRDRAIGASAPARSQVLVATDVAARGIDIPGVAYVINYDLPDVPENYVHRIGRTARAGREGEAIAFCAPEEADLLHQIQKLMKIEVPVASGTPHSGNGASIRADRGIFRAAGGEERKTSEGTGSLRISPRRTSIGSNPDRSSRAADPRRYRRPERVPAAAPS